MREENNINKTEEVFDNPDDILALLQDYSDRDSEDDTNEMDSSSGYEEDNQEFNENDDLLALLDMISVPIDYNDEQDILSLQDNETWDNGPSALNKNNDIHDDINNSYDSSNIWNAPIDIPLVETEESYSTTNGGNLSDVFSEAFSAIDTLNDKHIANETKDIPSNSNKIKEAGVTEKKENIFNKLFNLKSNDDKKTLGVDDKSKPSKDEKKTKAKVGKAKVAKSTKEVKKKEFNKKTSSKKDSDEMDDFEDGIGKRNVRTSTKSLQSNIKDKKQKKKIIKNKVGEEIVEAIQEEDTKPINKKIVGGVVFLWIAIGLLVISGTNMYSYSLSIDNAMIDFERGRYQDAYDQIYGLDIKKKDVEIYEKVMTVMYVNTHLISYTNFYDFAKYPEALDSLITGIKRYEQYIEVSEELAIKEDLDKVKHNILNELSSKFDISEEEAYDIANIEDQKEYSKKVYSITSNKNN